MISFDPIGHIYRDAQGSRIVSVTQALSIVERGFQYVKPDVLEAARQFGSHVHLSTHLFDRGRLNEKTLDHELAMYLAQYKQFLFDTKARVLDSEQIVFNAQMRYAGQLDKRLHWKRNTWLGDLKSGAVPRTVGAQVEAYRRACGPEAPRKRLCLQLRRHDYKLTILDNDSDWSLFISALNCTRFLQRKTRNDSEEETRSGTAAASSRLHIAESGNPF